MLDTHMASYVIKGHPPEARQRLAALPMESIVVSVVTQAELLCGLARKGHPAAFSRLIREFLVRVQVLPWDGAAAARYAGRNADRFPGASCQESSRHRAQTDAGE